VEVQNRSIARVEQLTWMIRLVIRQTQNRAIDLDDTFGHKTNAEMFKYIKENLNYDQMIWEFGDDNNPDWVHVSYVSPDENRGRCLKAYKENGKSKYMVI